ncbi:hypothetical protein A3E49_01940 [Candidatus Saccharibacteria bacterium RIFCSPHIGHO2_12_FULL_49_19]|nr:MAG: hypothetical protein A2708_00040 [Candidatus Saccharibacteria bacterium RIFCSPHIGHO2_01_FULL_49_21]OGL36494.1 MAG: hypothetical protein A3E49_01940 [Candidatus Saccharibacteria bacterium RIFCSPHIGHO2_12_FULL_49_19]OGL38035.1 MAG: hypothetical protein A3B63_03765 [Candidatus Saccharibacteria bacterium RIFCSPLOWO2_01_FULL_49_22]
MIKAVIFDFFGVLEQNQQPNREVLDYVKNQLKPKYKIGIVSNVLAGFIYLILSPDDLKLFDDVVLSYEAGVAKPEPRIYELAMQNLGVKPEEAVFIDDQEHYVEAAKTLGMKGIYFQDFKQMKSDLEKLLRS